MTHRGPFQPLLFCDSVILSLLKGLGHWYFLYQPEEGNKSTFFSVSASRTNVSQCTEQKGLHRVVLFWTFLWIVTCLNSHRHNFCALPSSEQNIK